MLRSLEKKEEINLALAYYRHSRPKAQEQSVPIQRERARKFAQENRMEIIHEEADEGHSGLLADRPGFRRLFDEWIGIPTAPKVKYLLINDVTRFGRFQKTDEAAYYSFICDKAGVQIIYLEDGIPTENQSLMFDLQTVIRRFQAADFSRQQSAKVKKGACEVVKEGFFAGGRPAFGLGRQLYSIDRNPKQLLQKGEHKSISNERVKPIPLNDETTEAVKTIFHLYVNEWKNIQEIAEHINSLGVPTAMGLEWKPGGVLRTLRNPAYIGKNIYNKNSNYLKTGRKKNSEDDWVVRDEAFPAIIDRELFFKAQERLYWSNPRNYRQGALAIHKVRKFLADDLKELFLKNGIDKAKVSALVYRFPLTFGVSFYHGAQTQNWCFLISEAQRAHDFIIGIGVNKETEEIDKVFLLPTRDFGLGNFMIFSQTDNIYSLLHVPSTEVENRLMSLVPLV
jgi:DNA invertase Pin-like site-specific DNA recombinase